MSVHIIVCIKSVVKAAPKGVAKRTPENSELNPFDRPALEAAMQVKESVGGSVTVLTMGPPVSMEVLAEAQAMGADKAVLISDSALAESDTLVTSKVLAKAIAHLGEFDFVFFGTRTADSDTGQVGPQTAALLNIPFVSRIKEISLKDDHWDVQRTMDAWEERWHVAAPAAVTVDPRAYCPRPVGLVGISKVYGQPDDQPDIEQWSLVDLQMNPQEVGLAGSPTRVAALEKIERKRACEMLEGEPQAQVEDLIARLTSMGAIG
jgi:electron transfer flavoprotein beta subunit